MRTNIIYRTSLLCVLWLFSFSNVLAQQVIKEWAPIGAKWYYTQLSFSAPDSSYRTFQSVVDTVWKGRSCKMLEQYIHFNSGSYFVDFEFMYSDSGRVYHYHRQLDTWYVLYDFNTLPGQSWNVIPPDTTWGKSFNAIVDSLDTMIINNDTLKVIYAHSDSFAWTFGYNIIEKLGYTSFMFPQLSFMDPPVGGPLRCYYENTLLIYKNFGTLPCDFTTTVDEISNIHAFDVYFDNSHKNLVVNTSGKEAFTISIFSSMGQLLYKQTNLHNPIQMVNLSFLLAGVYIAIIEHENTFKEKKIVLIN